MVFGILGEHRPSGAHVFVGQGYRGLALAAALDDGPQPSVLGRFGFLHVIHVGACTLDQHGT